MKKILYVLLSVVTLLSVCITTTSCTKSYDDIRAELFELKEKGEVTGVLEGIDNSFLSALLQSLNIKNANDVLYAYKGSSPAPRDSEGVIVISFDAKSQAKKAYDVIKELEEGDEEIYLKRKGLVVIYGDIDFCKDIFK